MKVKVNKKKTILIVFFLLVVFICGNAFAALVGVPNIFFAIRDMVSTEEKFGTEEILSDRDITISYSPIKIKDGVELQVNRILIEETKSTLFITLENKNKDKDKEIISINVYDMLENNNTNDVLSEDKFLVPAESKKNFEIELNKKVSEEEKLKLEIIVDEKVVARNVILDLAAKEIVVEGKEETKKISEKELKEYLDILTVLNSTKNFTENDRLIYAAIELGNYLEIDIPEQGNRDIINKIVESMYDANFEENDKKLLGLEDIYFGYDKKLDSYKYVVNMGGALNKVMCLSIEDIAFKDGVYTIEYVYALPVDDPEVLVEDYAQYRTTIELKLSEDSEYSKYKVISLTEGVKLDKSEDVSVDNIKEENNKEEKNENKTENSISEFYKDFKLVSEVAVLDSNLKEENVFNVDLDNDGKKEEIKVKYELNEISVIEKFIIEVNNKTIYEVEDNNIPFNYILNFYIVDLNKTDSYLDFVIASDAASADYMHTVMKYNGEKFDCTNLDGGVMYSDKKGNVIVQNGVFMNAKACINPKYYSVTENKMIDLSIDDIKDSLIEFENVYFTEDLNNIGKVLNDWESSFETSLEKNNIKEYDSVKAYVIDFKNDKVKVKLEDGTIGYLFIGAGNFAG